MKAKISELMDSELHGAEATAPLSALREEGGAREAWRTYHLISDAMRDTGVLSPGFSDRMVRRLAEEPAVLAPAAWRGAVAETVRRRLLPTAATAAAVALVGWIAFAPQDVPPPVPVVQAPVTKPVPKEPARVLPPAAAHDYLLAHQGYSPRNLLQGVAPYVRTVSGEAAQRKR